MTRAVQRQRRRTSRQTGPLAQGPPSITLWSFFLFRCLSRKLLERNVLALDKTLFSIPSQRDQYSASSRKNCRLATRPQEQSAAHTPRFATRPLRQGQYKLERLSLSLPFQVRTSPYARIDPKRKPRLRERPESWPRRLNTRTRSSSPRQMNLKPSCLISKAHSGPSGTVLLDVGRHGSIKPGGWTGPGLCQRIER
jgi:hypothetical protein